ncbi:MAG: BON domain-containing protein [Planctomycetales bacterium]|nr:BON domain-containing protein [Planctomycetales bacterium]
MSSVLDSPLAAPATPATVTFDADIDLARRAEEILINSPYLNGQRLRLESHAGQLTLRGHVRTYFQKQMAQESLRRLEGISSIVNQLEVTW